MCNRAFDFSFSTGTMARVLQRASQPVHPLLEPAKELRPGQQLERGWSTHQVKFLVFYSKLIYNRNLLTFVMYLQL
jgi:hypothetical protein